MATNASNNLGQNFRKKLAPVQNLFDLIEIFINTEERMRDSVLPGIRQGNHLSGKSISDLKWMAVEASELLLQQKLEEFVPLMEKIQQFLAETDARLRLEKAKELKAMLDQKSSLIQETILLAEEEDDA